MVDIGTPEEREKANVNLRQTINLECEYQEKASQIETEMKGFSIPKIFSEGTTNINGTPYFYIVMAHAEGEEFLEWVEEQKPREPQIFWEWATLLIFLGIRRHLLEDSPWSSWQWCFCNCAERKKPKRRNQ